MNSVMSAFDMLMKIAEQNITRNDDDYIEDGLLMCGKCHTPKQCRVKVLDQVKMPYCACKCESEKLQREAAEQECREKAAKIEKLRIMGFPDAEMRNFVFEKDDLANTKISRAAMNYVDNFPKMMQLHKGLLLYGPVGTGKTFMAACIANALIDCGYTCLVTNFARLVNTITGCENRQSYIDGLNEFALLVIDDLAAERDTEYMQEIVTNIIDARYRSGKPMIVTTNLTADELKFPQDMRRKRVYSRLFEMCYPIEVDGRDRRKERLKNDFRELGELLGVEV